MIINTLEFCKLFYGTTAIPISLISNNQTSYYYPEFTKSLHKLTPIKNFISENINACTKYNYASTNSAISIGILKLNRTDEYIVVGPAFNSILTDSIIQQYHHELHIPADIRNEFEKYIYYTPRTSIHQLFQALTLLNLCLNDDETPLNDLPINSNASSNSISALHTNILYTAKEEQNYHLTYNSEMSISKLIQNGEVDKILKLIKTTTYTYSEGTVADNIIRQKKNIFISSITLYTRSAIAGGLDIEQAYHLSDIYINKCEKLQKAADIERLLLDALLDFTKRVSENKMPQGISSDIFQCIQYIHRHTNEPIRVYDVAGYVQKSPSYLAKKFKRELGFDMSSFIMRCKLEEAKSLLSFSEKSLSDISTYLCFSSQSYFQNIFKKTYHITPLKYRNQTKYNDK